MGFAGLFMLAVTLSTTAHGTQSKTTKLTTFEKTAIDALMLIPCIEQCLPPHQYCGVTQLKKVLKGPEEGIRQLQTYCMQQAAQKWLDHYLKTLGQNPWASLNLETKQVLKGFQEEDIKWLLHAMMMKGTQVSSIALPVQR